MDKKENKDHITQKSALNAGNIRRNSNTLEIYQPFTFSNEQDTCLSRKYAVNIQNEKFVLLSAYLEEKENACHFFYRLNSDNIWVELEENKEVHHPSRRVFKPKNIFGKIDQIQFKSSHTISKEVVFRLYIAN